MSDPLLGGRALDLDTRTSAIAALLQGDQILGELGLHRHQREAIEGGLADVLVGAVEQGLDHDSHAADAHQVGVVAGIGSRGQIVEQRRALVEALAAEDADLGLGERVELRRQRIPDLGHADLFVGQAARGIELREEPSHQASTVVDVVLGVGRGMFYCLLTYLRYIDMFEVPL